MSEMDLWEERAARTEAEATAEASREPGSSSNQAEGDDDDSVITLGYD
jgi:hypothetical protein